MANAVEPAKGQPMEQAKWQQRLWASFRETVGIPVGIRSWVDQHAEASKALLPRLQQGGISEAWVTAWHRLGDDTYSTTPYHQGENGVLWGWQRGSSQNPYTRVSLPCEALGELGRVELRHVVVDIQSIGGMAASKSELTDVGSMREFALRHCSDWIKDLDASFQNDEAISRALYLNLGHDQIRIVRPDTAEVLSAYAWDRRLFLSNSGGSHHFALARYIAEELREPVPIEATLSVASINPRALDQLCHQFTMWLVDDEQSLHAALRSFGAPYYAVHLPLSREVGEQVKGQVIFLPRSDTRSARVAGVMLAAGMPDVGEHLVRLATRQPNALAALAAMDLSDEQGFNGAALREQIEQAKEERLASYESASLRQ